MLAPYFTFQWLWAIPIAGLYTVYYFAFEPVAAVSQLPQFRDGDILGLMSINVVQLLYLPLLSILLLSASPIAATPWGVNMAIWLMVISWVAQFAGHGFAEKRAPALLNNLIGGV